MNIYHYMDIYASGITGQHRAFPVAPETTQAVSSMGINSPRRFLHVQKQPGRKRYSQTPVRHLQVRLLRLLRPLLLLLLLLLLKKQTQTEKHDFSGFQKWRWMVFGRNFDASSSFTGMVLSHLANVILEVRRFCEQNLFPRCGFRSGVRHFLGAILTLLRPSLAGGSYTYI